MIYYYQLHQKLLFSYQRIRGLAIIQPDQWQAREKKYIYYLRKNIWTKFNPMMTLIHPSQLEKEAENINILKKSMGKAGLFKTLPGWIKEKIEQREVGLCNYHYPRWKERLGWEAPHQWKVNVVGLGNVGGTLLIGLKILGAEKLQSIGIFDTNQQVLKRWDYEMNQIIDGSNQNQFPPVVIIKPEDIFSADIVIFCVSIGVPPAGQYIKDVRMMQLEANSKIINHYAKRARKMNYNGIFAVVSDPVDLLCQKAFLASNDNGKGQLDGMGLSPDQIRGFGLGVMHGRAAYYAEKNKESKMYRVKGRAFGPHGKGLIIVNNIENYNQNLSRHLTEKAIQANIAVRKTGYKPYIAPALSSGALSVMGLIKGQWHYSAGFLGGIFWGARNRLTPTGIEWEQYDFPETLFQDLQNSYQELAKLANRLD